MRLTLAVLVVVVGPIVGAVAIGLSVALSGTSWEEADPGSSARLLPLVAFPLWGAIVQRVARRGMGRWAALPVACVAAAWSVCFWWLLVVVLA